MPIRVLSEVVAAQIAAGEVVERPASVVKELIENALDAGATSIRVEVEQGGQRLIRVSDDGVGIPAGEIALAFERHATSKLESVADLDHIATLGFRGEALASIASVARVTLVSRWREGDAGAEIQVEGGETRHVRPVGAPVGTVVTVENLFFNTPARRKFLKGESTERRHINQLVTRYAMAYPHVRFRLEQDGREQFHSTGSGDLADVLVEVFGLDVVREMLEVSPQPPARADLPPVEVYGFTSVPALHRANRLQIILFVNGRSIQDQSLTYAVAQAYHTLLPQGKHPVAVLLITLPPEEVDVNVHPTKAEVRFRAPDAVFAAVQRALRAALAGQTPVGGVMERGGAPGWGLDDERAIGPGAPRVPGEDQLRLGLEAFGLETVRPGTRRPPADPTAIPAGAGRPDRPRTLPILRVVGQVGATYIVAEGPAGLYLLDQHAASYRALYDRLAAARAAGAAPATQPWNVTIALPPRLAGALEDGRAHLAAWGFAIEDFGSNTFRVRAVPVELAEEDPEDVLRALAEALLDVGRGDPDERLLRQIARLGAIKAGQALAVEQMQGLIQALERCPSPREDPDGRPTMVHISGEDLARQFGRGGSSQ